MYLRVGTTALCDGVLGDHSRAIKQSRRELLYHVVLPWLSLSLTAVLPCPESLTSADMVTSESIPFH